MGGGGGGGGGGGRAGQNIRGQDVAGGFAGETLFGGGEEQVDELFLVPSDQRSGTVDPLGKRHAGFGEEHVGGEIGEGDSGVDVAEFVEKRDAQTAVAETAAETFDGLFRIASLIVAIDDATEPFAGNFGRDLFVHFNKDEIPTPFALRIKVYHSMPCRSRPGKRIQYQVAIFGNLFNQ